MYVHCKRSLNDMMEKTYLQMWDILFNLHVALAVACANHCRVLVLQEIHSILGARRILAMRCDQVGVHSDLLQGVAVVFDLLILQFLQFVGGREDFLVDPILLLLNKYELS